jgi:hypothetical protein
MQRKHIVFIRSEQILLMKRFRQYEFMIMEFDVSTRMRTLFWNFTLLTEIHYKKFSDFANLSIHNAHRRNCLILEVTMTLRDDQFSIK